MTPEQKALLKLLFTTGYIRDLPNQCRADCLRENLEYVDDHVGGLPHKLPCFHAEAFDALVAFYVERREAG